MIHHLKLDRGNALMPSLQTADMPAWFQNMNQNSGTASQVAHSSQRGGDVDVSAKESCCQSSVSWSNVVQSPETQLWCMSTDSFLTQRILPAYNKMSHVKFKLAVNGSKIQVPYLKSREETFENCNSNFSNCWCCLWDSLHFTPEFWFTASWKVASTDSMNLDW